MATILLGVLALGFGGYRVARRGFGLPEGFAASFGGFVLAWTWVSLGTLGLGLAGWLYRGPLLAWSAVPAILSLLLLRSRPGPSAEDVTLARAEGGWGPSVALAIGLALWAILTLFIPSLLLPVKVISDGPIYHLYFAARWWQAGRIFLIPTPFGATVAPYFPAIGDLWLTWLFVLGGGETLAKVGQMPFFLVAIQVVYALGLKAGARPSASAIAACWFATISPLLVFVVEPNVDLVFVAGYMLAFYFLARFVFEGGGPASLLLGGLAAGGAWGTKAPGIVFVPPLLVVVAGVALARPGPIGVRVRNAAVVLLAPLVLEAYWPARNAWLTGNPLYPLQVTAFGHVIFPGWYGPEAMSTSRYYIAARDWRSAIDIALAVFDPRLIPVWIAAVCGAWRIGRPASTGDRLAWSAGVLALVNLALYWLFVPYRTQQRFIFHATALAAIPLARLLDRGRLARAVAVTLLALHTLTPQDWPFSLIWDRLPWDFSRQVPSRAPSPIIFLANLDAVVGHSALLDRRSAIALLLVGTTCLVAGFLACWARRGAPSRWFAPSAALMAALIVQSAVLYSRVADPVYFRFPYFVDYVRGWAEVDSRIGKTPARIAYAGTNLPYYLLGKDFQNEVRYVNVDAHADWLMHDYHRAAAGLGLPSVWPDSCPGWDRIRPDETAWLANLDAAGIQFLVVTKADPLEGRFNCFDRQGFPVERTLADRHRERFTLLYSDELFRLYAVRGAKKIAPGSTDRPSRPH